MSGPPPGRRAPASARCSSPAPTAPGGLTSSNGGRSRRASASSTRSTASTSRSLSCRTLVYKGMLTTPQLAAVLPGSDRRACRAARWPSCTAGSRPTRSRRGRWPTRTATSPTTARSTPAGQPQLDAGPRGAARSPTSRRRPRAALPDLTPGAPTRPASTRSSSCCTSAGRSLPHAVLMMIPEAWENHARDGRRHGAPSTGSTPR